MTCPRAHALHVNGQNKYIQTQSNSMHIFDIYLDFIFLFV
jgi:hypothetical protein